MGTLHTIQFVGFAHGDESTGRNVPEGIDFHEEFMGAIGELATIMPTSNVPAEQVAAVMEEGYFPFAASWLGTCRATVHGAYNVFARFYHSQCTSKCTSASGQGFFY